MFRSGLWSDFETCIKVNTLSEQSYMIAAHWCQTELYKGCLQRGEML